MSTRAVIVAIGTELTTGQTIDTNSSYIAARLAEAGIETLAHLVVDDNQGRIVHVLRQAAQLGQVVVVSGGLGPTADDLTRQALAEAMGVQLVLHEPSLRHVEEFFRRRNRVMAEVNRIQAMVPAGAEALDNPVGTAPGLFGHIGGVPVFVVPGVPSEMRRMIREQVLPRLAAVGEQQRMAFRIVHTFGSGESDIGAAIADLMHREANPMVGTTVAAGLVSIRIIARGKSADEARELAEQAVQTVQGRLGKWVIGCDEETMSAAVGRLLQRRSATLCVAESCTGGLLGEMITEVSGSSEYFVGGAISYANRVKQEWLGVGQELLVRHGAVSEPVAAAMAEGARKKFGATYALSVTGIAGPTGGTPEKPVGLVYVGLSGPAGVEVERFLFPGDRQMVRLRCALAALNKLRLTLIEG